MKKILPVLLIGAVAYYLYKQYQSKQTGSGTGTGDGDANVRYPMDEVVLEENINPLEPRRINGIGKVPHTF